MSEIWELGKVKHEICRCGSDIFNIQVKVLSRRWGMDNIIDRTFSFYEFTCVKCGEKERFPVEPMADACPNDWERF